MFLCALVPEEIAFQAAIPQAYMRMPTASIFLVIPLGHEGCRQTHLVTNFFDAGFEEHCSIASLQSIGIADVHLVHTGSMFAVVAFDIDIAVAHHTSDASQQMIIGAGLADGVAVVARIQWGQVWPKVLFSQRRLALTEEAKFQFGSSQRLISHRAGAFYDFSKNVPRRNSHRLSVLGPQVAYTRGHVFFPWYKLKCGEIGLHHNICKTMLPVTELEIRQHNLGNVPAKEHITLPKPIFQRVQEVPCIHALEDGFGQCDVLFGWDIAEVVLPNLKFSNWEHGFADIVMKPDLSTFELVPWEENVASCVCDL